MKQVNESLLVNHQNAQQRDDGTNRWSKGKIIMGLVLTFMVVAICGTFIFNKEYDEDSMMLFEEEGEISEEQLEMLAQGQLDEDAELTMLRGGYTGGSSSNNYQIVSAEAKKKSNGKPLAHISTDKPIYKPNDVAFIEVFAVDPLTKEPSRKFYQKYDYKTRSYSVEKSKTSAQISILDNFKKEVYKSTTVEKDGTFVFTYKVPKDAKGGEYQIKITSNDFPTSFRKFRINQYSQPELLVTVDFDKNNYSSGEIVKAKIKVRKPDGSSLQPGSSLAFEVGQINIPDDKRQFLTLNQQGEKIIEFKIPQNIELNALTISLKVFQGYSQQNGDSVPSTSTHSVPILQKDAFTVKFFPDFSTKNSSNAELVPGVENKVYFQVMSDEKEGGKAVPIEFFKATFYQSENTKMERFFINPHYHQGRSFIIFTPSADENIKQQLRIQKSKDSTETLSFDFPKVNRDLVYSVHFEEEEYNEFAIFGSRTSKTNIGLSLSSNHGKFLQENSKGHDALKVKKLNVTLFNKGEKIYESDFDIEAAHTMISLSDDKIYDKLPNGGVLTLRVFSPESTKIVPEPPVTPIRPYRRYGNIRIKPEDVKQDEPHISFEKLIFINPKKTVPFTIKTDKKEYQPGDQVNLDVQLDDKKLDSDDKYFASITVTDVSSFLQVPKEKLMPSLPAMVYLEKEIKQMNGQVDEFLQSTDYVNAVFDISEDIEKKYTDDQTNYYNLDYLLGVQDWRKGKLDDINSLKKECRALKKDTKERLVFEYLLGKKPGYDYGYTKNYIGGRGGFRARGFGMGGMGRNFAMDMAPAANGPVRPMGMDIRRGVIRRKQPEIQQEDESQQPENQNSSDSDSTQQDEDFNSELDFMLNIPKNIRLYSHSLRNNYNKFGPRVDFTQTIFFESSKEFSKDANNVIQKLSSKFFLNDQISQFQISVNLFSSKGKYGMATKTLKSSRSVYSQFTLPTTFVRGDKLDIPITVSNNREYGQKLSVVAFEYALTPKKTVVNAMRQEITIAANSQHQVIYKLDSGSQKHESQDNVQLEVSIVVNGEMIDKVIHNAKMIADGFDQERSTSGRIGLKDLKDAKKFDVENIATWNVEIPKTLTTVPTFTAKMFAKPLDNVLDAMESLIREPTGCFEQTSSTTYPMTMALGLLKELENSLTDQEEIAKVKKMIQEIIEKLKKGYKRLVGFETSTKGYEWFGKSPGHETLTGYGLAQFNDMKKVVDFVDIKSHTRNTKWLLSRRNTNGKFSINPKALDTFGRSSQDVSDAYLLWVLSNTDGFGYDELVNEFKNLEQISHVTKDPYVLSLYSGALFNVGKNKEALAISKRVASNQNETTGAVEGATSSITNSRGQSLLLETTSLALVNWLNQSPSDFSTNIDKGVTFLLSSIKSGGRFGSTQSTVLTLKALTRYAQIYQGIKGRGNFKLHINGVFVSNISYNEENKSMKKLDFSDDMNKYFKANYTLETFKGQNFKIQVSIDDYDRNKANDGFALSYLIQSDFKDSKPPSAKNAPIEFSIDYNPNLVSVKQVGDTQSQLVKVKNASGNSQGMVVAILSTPSCIGIDMNQFEILKERGMIDNYEISADKTLSTLYWTYLKKDETKEVSITRVRKFGGDDSVCQNRASQAYLYYQDEDKVWIKK